MSTRQPITYTGQDHLGEYLLTVYGDGAAEFAFREQSWQTWSPPVRLTATPMAAGQ